MSQTAAVLEFDDLAAAIPSGSQNLGAMDATYNLFYAATAFGWRITNTIGASGSRELIEVAPPVDSPFPDQRFLFVTKSSGTPDMLSPDAFVANEILFMYAPDGDANADGDLANWHTGANPYGTSRAMGFFRGCPVTGASTWVDALLYVSPETLIIGYRSTAGVYAVLMGSLWAAEGAASSETGTVKGAITSGTSVIGDNWGTSWQSFMNNRGFDGNVHVWAFLPNTSTIVTARRTTLLYSDNVKPITRAGDIQAESMYYMEDNDPNYYRIGRLREVYYCSGRYRSKYQVDSLDRYLVFSGSTSSDWDALFLLANQ